MSTKFLCGLTAGLLRCFRCANLRNCAVLCAERECARGFDGVPGNVFAVVGLA
jgi:hypothetical protein